MPRHRCQKQPGALSPTQIDVLLAVTFNVGVGTTEIIKLALLIQKGIIPEPVTV